MNVNLEVIEAWLSLRKEMNSVPIEEIVWLRNGIPLPVTQEQIENWRFVGMSNAAFAECVLAEVKEAVA